MARTRAGDRGTPYFPAFLDLVGKRVVVVGGGHVAASKVRALVPCRPSELLVIAPRLDDSIQKVVDSGDVVWHPREYVPGDLEGAALAFGATDNRADNARVADEARQRGIPVLAVDDVPNCDFIAPALVRRGDLTVAISTGGRSPALARRTREYLERMLPAVWGDLLDVAARARDALGDVRPRISPDAWQVAIDGEVEELTRQGALEQATALLLRRLEASASAGTPPESAGGRGFVALVGAGPGDPDLLTVKAVKLLQAADTIVYDRLVGPGALDYARADAELVDVGKVPGRATITQTEINDLLIARARAGQRVVRLKGGDPFVFGRGGEEALALADAGVRCEVIPGISAALAAPAAAGIPVTHRGLSASVSVLTGHDPDAQDWAALAAGSGTLVVLMGVENLSTIASRLIAAGRAPEEPAAVVQSATVADQRTVVARLADIADRAVAAGIAAPAVLVVGPTVDLAARVQASRVDASTRSG